MNNIKIKIKDKEPSDESILDRKNFSSVINEYKTIKSSYAKVASFWGATIGMTVFLAFAASETLGTKAYNRSQPNKKLTESAPSIRIEPEKISASSAIEIIKAEDTESLPSPAKEDYKQTKKKVSKKEVITAEDNSKIKTEVQKNTVEELKKINVKYIPD